MFMECFQGYYCDRSDGGWECRYFSALYPTLRIASDITYSLTRGKWFPPLESMMIILAMVLTLVVSPYKKKLNVHNKLDILLLASSWVVVIMINPSTMFTHLALSEVISTVPLVCLTLLVVRHFTSVCHKREQYSSFYVQNIAHSLWQWSTKCKGIGNEQTCSASRPLLQSAT